MIEIRPAHPHDLVPLAACDFSFTIERVAMGPFDGPGITHTEPVQPPRAKQYEFDADELGGYLNARDRALFVVETKSSQAVGYLAISHAWNRFASIDDIAIDAAHRRLGAARKLMDAAIAWARGEGLAGVRLETQSNNVGACLFYQRYGFVLGGYDRYVYSALDEVRDEVALFWYLRFGGGGGSAETWHHHY